MLELPQNADMHLLGKFLTVSPVAIGLNYVHVSEIVPDPVHFCPSNQDLPCMLCFHGYSHSGIMKVGTASWPEDHHIAIGLESLLL